MRNLASGTLVGHSEHLVPGQVSRSAVDVEAGRTRLRYQPRSGIWSFGAAGRGFAVSLDQRPDKPYVLNGDGTGLIQQSLAGSAHRDWFSCRFDDRSELMLYQFRDRTSGRPLARFRTGSYVPRRGHAIAIGDFQAR